MQSAGSLSKTIRIKLIEKRLKNLSNCDFSKLTNQLAFSQKIPFRNSNFTIVKSLFAIPEKSH